jgi:hypothetical protein
MEFIYVFFLLNVRKSKELEKLFRFYSARGMFYLKTSSVSPYGEGKSTNTAEFSTTLSSNFSQYNMTDFRPNMSPCTKTELWITVH